MLIRDAFPRWWRLSRHGSDPLWKATVNRWRPERVRDLALLIRRELGGADHRIESLGLTDVSELADAICEDVEESLRPWSDDLDLERQIAGALLIATASGSAGFKALDVGEIRQALHWVLRPILRPEADDWYINIAPSRGSMFFDPRAGIADGLLVPFITEWAELLFVYERFRGPIDAAGRLLFDKVQPWVIARLESDPNVWRLALIAAEWSGRRADVDDADLQTALFKHSRTRPLSGDLEVALAVHLAEAAEQRGASPATEARKVLSTMWSRLNGTQRLRLVGLGSVSDPEGTVLNLSTIVAIVEATMRDWRTTTPRFQTMGDRRGAHFKLIGTFISVFLKANRPDLIGEVVGAWLEVDPPCRRRDLLFWFAMQDPGVGWATRQEVEIRDDINAVARYLDTLQRFTGTVYAVADSDDFFEPTPPTGVAGVPNADWEQEFSEAALEVYSLEQLHRVLVNAALPPTALVVVPYLGCPIQAMLVRHFGRTWPWSVSMAQPHPDRVIQRVRIVVTGSLSGTVEASGLGALFESASITCEIIDRGDLGHDEFLDLYRDATPDVLWVIGHGEFDPSDPKSSCLPMPDGSSVRAPELGAPSASRRRLLVLNICEGGLAAVNGGLPELGIAVAATAPSQAAIGHLWPVRPWPDGPLFGRVLADGLARGLGFFAAYENAVRMLIAGPELLQNVLDGKGGELDSRLAEALERDGDPLHRIASWASAAFLE